MSYPTTDAVKYELAIVNRALRRYDRQQAAIAAGDLDQVAKLYTGKAAKHRMYASAYWLSRHFLNDTRSGHLQSLIDVRRVATTTKERIR